MQSFTVAKYPPRRSNSTFESVLEKGLGMAGVEKAKTGSDEKERGYLIRSGICYKGCMCLLVVVFLGLAYVFSTVLQINIVRRDVIDQEVRHRSSEHGAQIKLLSVQIEYQRAIEEQINDLRNIEEYRSILEHQLGDTTEKLNNLVSSKRALSRETSKQLETLLQNFGNDVLEKLDALIGRIRPRTDRASQRLGELALSILDDVKDEDFDQELYLRKLRQYGVKNPQKAEIERLKKIKDKMEAKHFEILERQRREAEGTLENNIEHFFKRIGDLNFPTLDSDVIDKLEKYEQDVLATLKDGERETDLVSVAKHFNEMLLQYAPTVSLYDASLGHSVSEFMSNVIFDAKMAPLKNELLALYRDWKEDKVDMFDVLSKIEQLKHQNPNILSSRPKPDAS